MFLLVKPNGSKLWRYKFRIRRVEGLQSLGAFPEVGLADARAAHLASRQWVAKGVNPVQHGKPRANLAHWRMHSRKETFETVFSEWDAATNTTLHPRTAMKRRREIEKDVLPAFCGRAIASITRLELTAAIKAVEARAPEMARNLRNYLWRIFEYAIDTGVMDNNPVPPGRVLRRRNSCNGLCELLERLAVELEARL